MEIGALRAWDQRIRARGRAVAPGRKEREMDASGLIGRSAIMNSPPAPLAMQISLERASELRNALQLGKRSEQQCSLVEVEEGRVGTLAADVLP